MFIDRFIENWDCFFAGYDGDNKRHACFGDNPPYWGTIKEFIKQSAVFKIDNIHDYLDTRSISIGDIPNARPPYDFMWFEFSSHGIGRVQLCNSGTLIESSERAKTIGLLFVSDYHDERKTGTTTGMIFTELNTSRISFSGIAQWFWEYDGHLRDEYMTRTPWIYELPESEKNHAIQTMQLLFLRPLFSISLMHCKNVEILSNDIPLKLRKAREKRGHLPLVKYHTLEIKPMVKILKETGCSEIKGLRYALHICRGHFKDFSKGSGLFGRHKGLYWWDSQVRGAMTEGITLKDYSVSNG